jgi:hypothetical protein
VSGQLVRRLLNKGMFEELKNIDLIDEEILAKRKIMLNLMRIDARLFNEYDRASSDNCCVEYSNDCYDECSECSDKQ